MEKKTTRRIIGVLVVIALVIVLLPLITNNSENPYPLETSEVKAPAFPGTENNAVIPVTTPTTITTTTTTVAKNPPPHIPPGHLGNGIRNTIVHEAAAPKQPLEPITEAQNDDDMGIENVKLSTPDLTTRAVADNENIIAIDSDGESAPSLGKTLLGAKTNKITSPVAPVVAKQTVKVPSTPVVQVMTASARPHSEFSHKHSIKTQQAKANTNAPALKKVAFEKSFESSEMSPPTTSTVSLKKAAWMVQLGIFNNKLNAERLTNTLRAKGYKAFTLQTRSGGPTRVCVGPESQQTSALQLASRIAEDTNMHGIVLAYKPLEI
jgi:cell division septation protein DedD